MKNEEPELDFNNGMEQEQQEVAATEEIKPEPPEQVANVAQEPILEHINNNESKSKAKENDEPLIHESEPHIDPLEDHMKNAINKYKDLLRLQIDKNTDTKFTIRLVSMMKKQLKAHLESRNPNPSITSLASLPTTKQDTQLEEKRMRGLNEIFMFYCKQQLLVGNKPTFEHMTTALNHMTLGELNKLCKDFAVPLSVEKIKESHNERSKG